MMNRPFDKSEVVKSTFPLKELTKPPNDFQKSGSFLDRSIVHDIEIHARPSSKDSLVVDNIFRSNPESSTIAKEYVLPEEYKKYRHLYDRIDSINASAEYKRLIISRIQGMSPEIKSVYNAYAKRFVCLDASFNGTSYFSPIEGGFKVDSSSDINNPRGAGSTFFHESGHMIDWLLGKEVGAPYISSYSKLTQAIQNDLDNNLTNIMQKENCDLVTAKHKLSEELMSHPYDSSCVSDVFGGLTDNAVSGFFGHSKEYWKARDKDTVGCEAFAEISAQIVCSPSAFAYTQSLMPTTVRAYMDIIEEAGRYHK